MVRNEKAVHSMKMQTLKKRAEIKSRVRPSPVKRTEMVARALELKELEERKHAITTISKGKQAALVKKGNVLMKKTV